MEAAIGSKVKIANGYDSRFPMPGKVVSIRMEYDGDIIHNVLLDTGMTIEVYSCEIIETMGAE